jgi:hypothetical protein
MGIDITSLTKSFFTSFENVNSRLLLRITSSNFSTFSTAVEVINIPNYNKKFTGVISVFVVYL